METIDEQYSTLRGLSYTGALEDMLIAYYKAIYVSTHTALNDLQYYYLRSLGYTGALDDMLKEHDSVFAP